MRIGELAKRTGIPASTLRYYEDIGLIPPPPRISGQRDYDDSVFQVLNTIQLAQKADFSLHEIRQLLRERNSEVPMSVGWRRIAEGKLIEVRQTIEENRARLKMLEASLACECRGPDDCQMLY